MRVTVSLAALLFLAIPFSVSPTARPWTFGASLLLAAVGCLGVLESFLGRVELGEQDIQIVELFRRRRIAREDIRFVKWEKGGPVFLRLRDDTWSSLPSTGHANTKVAGAVRAWLNDRRATGGAVQSENLDAEAGT
jgi:hypothetical protein